MYDYTLSLQAKQRIEEIGRASAQRHWLRDLVDAQKAARDARKEPATPVIVERKPQE